VLLADRIAVMSARPGRIKEIVDTAFPGVKSAEVQRTREYSDKVDYVWSLVREEAIAASVGG
jgi:NitT/TauT family transport system ATP-binding protein